MSDNIDSGAKSALTIEEYEKRLYDMEQFIKIARSLCSTMKFERVVSSILFSSMSLCHVAGAGIFILDSLDDNIYRYYSNDEKKPFTMVLKGEHPLIALLKSSDECIKSDDIPRKFKNELKLPDTISLWVPIKKGKELLGVLILGERIAIGEGDTAYSDYEKWQCLTLASLSSVAIYNAMLMDRVSRDAKTRLRKSDYLIDALSERLEANATTGQGIALIMMDIDFLSNINQRYGMLCGDFVLKTVARVVSGMISAQDMAAHYKGDRFLIMLSGQSATQAAQIAKRLRNIIGNMTMDYEHYQVRVTVSLGVASYDRRGEVVDEPLSFIARADDALKQAKLEGRNTVVLTKYGREL